MSWLHGILDTKNRVNQARKAGSTYMNYKKEFIQNQYFCWLAERIKPYLIPFHPVNPV